MRAFEGPGHLTNETVFDLRQMPPQLAVVGAGPIGCELAQAFARFGSRVVLLDMAPQVLPREDADAAAVVERQLERDGVELRLGASIEEVARHDGMRTIRIRRDGAVDHLVVDERLRTENRRIFAAGDVASRFQFTHSADAQARIVLQNAFFLGRKRNDALIVPWVTFTSPEVAHVGLSGEEAGQRGRQVETLTVPLAQVDRARLDGTDEGFLRLHLAAGSDRILGATLVAENAGDMISEITLAMTAGVGLGSIAGVIHPYPTQAEVIKRAADAWRRGTLTPVVQTILRAWFRIFRTFT